jgi:serine protease
VSLSQGRSGNDEVMPGQVIVGLRDMAQADAVARAHGLAVGQRGLRGDWLVMHGAAAGTERGKAAEVAGDSRVRYAEPNYLRQPTAIDSRLWAFYNPGGLNMRYTKGERRPAIAASYASIADADEDNVENYAAGGGTSSSAASTPAWTCSFRVPPAASSPAGTGTTMTMIPPGDDGHGSHTTGDGRFRSASPASRCRLAREVYVQKVCGRAAAPVGDRERDLCRADYPLVAMNLSLGGSRSPRRKGRRSRTP